LLGDFSVPVFELSLSIAEFLCGLVAFCSH